MVSQVNRIKMISLPGLSEPVAFSLMNKSMSSSTLQFSRVLRIFSFAYQQRRFNSIFSLFNCY